MVPKPLTLKLSSQYPSHLHPHGYTQRHGRRRRCFVLSAVLTLWLEKDESWKAGLSSPHFPSAHFALLQLQLSGWIHIFLQKLWLTIRSSFWAAVPHQGQQGGLCTFPVVFISPALIYSACFLLNRLIVEIGKQASRVTKPRIKACSDWKHGRAGFLFFLRFISFIFWLL